MNGVGGHAALPAERQDDLRRAARLERWTLVWMVLIIAVMGLAMQSSQAMRTAWIEDMLSLVPPIVFLVAAHFERKPANAHFPFGYQRVNSLAFLIAAVALAVLGACLLVNALMTLAKQERVTIGLVEIAGHEFWAGWAMVAALAFSIVPPVILGRLKLPLAQRLQDKVLHTDALMNKADWMTGVAGIGGVLGLGFGLWWADALAAGLISLDILRDGIKALRVASAELVDGAPRALDEDDLAPDAIALERELRARFPGAEVRLRETGRYIRAVVDGAAAPDAADEPPWPGDAERRWRLAEISFKPR